MASNSAAGLFLVLGLILLTGHIAGTVSRQLGQPRVLGQLLIGVILGPTVVDMLHAPALGGLPISLTITDTIGHLAQLGVLLLMLNVGLDVNPGELLKVGRVAVLAGIGGSLCSVVAITAFMLVFGYSWIIAIFTGVALAATSVSISAQVLPLVSPKKSGFQRYELPLKTNSALKMEHFEPFFDGGPKFPWASGR